MATTPTQDMLRDEAQRLLYACQQGVGCIGCFLCDTHAETMADWCRDVMTRLRRGSAILADLPPRVPGTLEHS
jgi:hypothetical protein